jgi:hypothetical protein
MLSAPAPLGQPTSPAHASAVGPTHAAPRAEHAGDHYDPQAASVPGSPAASGFVDGAAKAIHHVAQIAKVVHDHGIGAVVPSKEDAKKWMHDFKENCLDHAKDCVTHKAQEAADELNRFRKLSRDDQVYAVSSTLGEAAPGMLASAIVPGGGVVVGSVIRTGEKAAGKALLKKAGKELTEEAAEHLDQVAARKLAREAQERAERAAVERTRKEATEKAQREAAARAVAEGEAKEAAENATSAELSPGKMLLWSSWQDYPKVAEAGRQYAQIGRRLYTEHAVERMLPPGLAGRGIAPSFVEAAIEQGTTTTRVVSGVARTIHTAGNVQVVTEQAGRIVVTVMRVGGP